MLENISGKRRASTQLNKPKSKRTVLYAKTLESSPSLENMCEDIILIIFKFLDTWSLLSLMSTCKSFAEFKCKKTLFKKLDLAQQSLPLGILGKKLKHSHDGTSCIKLRGASRYQYMEGELMFFNKAIQNAFITRCTNLASLEIFGVTLDFDIITLKDFPQTLKHLVFSTCNVRLTNQFWSLFNGIEEILVNLEELAIEYNSWFDPYYFRPISKLPSLRYLSLRGCSRMYDITYNGSLASQTGFKKLEVLDLRDTPSNDFDLHSLKLIATLKEIYLQSPRAKYRDDAQNNQISNFDANKVKPSHGGAVTDHGVCCFVCSHPPVYEALVSCFYHRPSDNLFQRFSIRDYKQVTDISLLHIVQCSPQLIFVDVSGTSVTLEGLQRVRNLRPTCKVVAEHLTDIVRSETTVL